MKNFIKRKENFLCLSCGRLVKGSGYTDHCPTCLWGRHVDRKIPGDRESECQGMMEPEVVIYEKNTFRIKYKCQKCRHVFVVKADKNDNRRKLMELCCGINSDNTR